MLAMKGIDLQSLEEAGIDIATLENLTD